MEVSNKQKVILEHLKKYEIIPINGRFHKITIKSLINNGLIEKKWGYWILTDKGKL
jgi:hypothetical protein